MSKRLYLILAYILININLFSAAQIQNLSISPECYIAGQYVTVTFETRAESAGNLINADIVFSADNIREYTDDAVLTAEGIYDTTLSNPDNDGHYGQYITQTSDTEFHQFEYSVKVPSTYSGSYYIFVAVKEASWVILDNGGNTFDAVTNVTINECTPTPTNTPTPIIGEGSAIISPTNVTAGGSGYTMSITYTAGATTWASGPDYGTLKILIPSGWSAPSTNGTDPGYFTHQITGGTLDSIYVDGNYIIIRVKGLSANTGTIAVFYGDKSGGGAWSECSKFTWNSRISGRIRSRFF